jgi:tyrosine aminotransferase
MNAFKGFEKDTDFVQALLQEEYIFVLPGKCFGIDNFFRVVTCPAREALVEAFDRLQQFCQRHYRGN